MAQARDNGNKSNSNYEDSENNSNIPSENSLDSMATSFVNNLAKIKHESTSNVENTPEERATIVWLYIINFLQVYGINKLPPALELVADDIIKYMNNVYNQSPKIQTEQDVIRSIDQTGMNNESPITSLNSIYFNNVASQSTTKKEATITSIGSIKETQSLTSKNEAHVPNSSITNGRTNIDEIDSIQHSYTLSPGGSHLNLIPLQFKNYYMNPPSTAPLKNDPNYSKMNIAAMDNQKEPKTKCSDNNDCLTMASQNMLIRENNNDKTNSPTESQTPQGTVAENNLLTTCKGQNNTSSSNTIVLRREKIPQSVLADYKKRSQRLSKKYRSVLKVKSVEEINREYDQRCKDAINKKLNNDTTATSAPQKEEASVEVTCPTKEASSATKKRSKRLAPSQKRKRNNSCDQKIAKKSSSETKTDKGSNGECSTSNNLAVKNKTERGTNESGTQTIQSKTVGKRDQATQTINDATTSSVERAQDENIYICPCKYIYMYM